ncbi:hypothetical protein BEL01nite_64220 [Bradyrhizobium elkanii]|nr:hypothetical protein BEL01nite_64220 [Bradyrhizobium elkanii]
MALQAIARHATARHATVQRRAGILILAYQILIDTRMSLDRLLERYCRGRAASGQHRAQVCAKQR